MKHSAPREHWQAFGIDRAAKMVGLTWGGTWDKYDPIHVQLDVNAASKQAIIAAMGEEEDAVAATKLISEVNLVPL